MQKVSRIKILGCALLLLHVTATNAAEGALATDAYSGTWNLEVGQGTSDSRSQVLTIVVEGTTETYRSELTLKDGTRQVTNYTAQYDGHEYPSRTVITDASGKLTQKDDTVILHRVDALIRERLWKRDGRLVRILRRSVSTDGRTLESQVIDVDAQGQEHPVTLLVFHKADAHGFADVVFTNGKVITVDAHDTIANSVAVVGNRIVAVGEVKDWTGPNTKVIDLQGHTLLPGFIDSHSHVAGMADTEAHYVNIQVPPLKDGKAIIAKLKETQAKNPPGAWLIGQGTYNQVMPTRQELDAAFPDNPVRLDWSAHDKLINHKAAIVMGLTKAFPDPGPGVSGHYERTPDGEVMIVRDAPAPWPKVKEFTYPELKEAVRGILEDFYLKRGVTTVSDMSSPTTYHAYQELKAEGRLPTRVRINYVVSKQPLAGLWPALSVADLNRIGLFTGFGDDWIRVGAVKIILDGVWGTTAAVYKPFWKGSGTTWIADNRGGTSWTQDELNAAVLGAHQAGWQVQIHANGDRAQDMVLDAYEAAQKAAPRADARDRIEHFGHFLVQDPQRTQQRLERMAQDHVIPSPQVAFLWRLTDVNIKEPDMTFFAMKTLISRGFHPAGGVDTIGTQNFATYPLFSIARAVRRDTKYGEIVQPEEAIPVMDGIRMFTIWSAYANFLEKTLGSVEVGKLADFVVLDSDPLTTPTAKLAEIPVDMTVLDGKIAYQRKP